MSFSDLQNERQNRQPQSFVKPTSETSSSPSNSGTSIASASQTVVSADGLYQVLPTLVEIRQTPSSGRGIFAKEKISRGSIIISTKPHVNVLSTKLLDAFCSACCAPAPPTGLKRCTRCRALWYCNAACQNSDWTMHKHECSALQKWAKSAPNEDVAIPSDAIRAMGRMLTRKKVEGLDSIWAKEVDGMQSHRSSMPTSAFESHTQLSHFLVKYLGVSSPYELAQYGIAAVADLVDVISRFVTNTVTLTAPDLTPIGIAISPPIALINHSCDPNTVIVFPHAADVPSKDEPLMQAVAIKDISPGEEVTASYIDTTLHRLGRLQMLKESYNFDCQCSLCSDTTGLDPRESMWCPKSCGGMCPVPTEENPLARCVKCKAAVSSTDAVLDALRVGQEALDKAASVQFADIDKAKQLTSNMNPILTSAGLTPSCHPLLAMTRLHQSLLIATLPHPPTQDHLDETIRTATKAITGLSSVLTEGHPIRGIALAELGKLLIVDEPEPLDLSSPSAVEENKKRYPPSGPPRLKLAYDTLVRARNELLIGFGSASDGGQVGRDVRECLVRVEAEVGTWKEGVKEALADSSRLKKVG
ncbi:hypothetical protein JAAARDRAFT_191683 [Jaapia argillacea MUCL 33604]|uniref:SET domain-containing protein n=1 Tax=Jaapia argillacea MUCL 33604 TaxID=933084 RepID=A0A067PZP1_9AGAM|nr:hypothetical protein JAAARDRAFT_191683 [Jaapia argillacea MUCL 33604]